MRFIKKHLCDLPACYAVTPLTVDGRTNYLFAPDDHGPCYSVDGDSGDIRRVWSEPGGAMSIIPLPSAQTEFLTVHNFFPGFQAGNSALVRFSYTAGKWRRRSFLQLPYLHRFGLLESHGRYYLLCCTLCKAKKSVDDWSSPGGLYGALLDPNFEPLSGLLTLREGLTRHHGYWQYREADSNTALISADQGVFQVSPPRTPAESWSVRRLIDHPVSDIARCDLDGDGQAELAAIEPFHGSELVLYRPNAGSYQEFYRYPDEFSFGHVVWGGKLRGENVFIAGCRAGRRRLFMVRWNQDSPQVQIIEEGAGPANIAVINGPDKDLLLVANHGAGEGAVFLVTDD